MATSPPAPLSPTSSEDSLPRNLSLEQLIEYFLAAKRSLLAASHVARAQEIVASARQSLEENAILNARTSFARKSIEKQLESLEAVRYGASLIDTQSQEEFEDTVQSLDIVDQRLQSTLKILHDTPVERAFRPAEEVQKHLFDFIDESGVNSLYESIKASIDRFDEARTSFRETCAEFDSEIERIDASLAPPTAADQDLEGGDEIEFHQSPLPQIFTHLEQLANQSAENLEGLAKHYDLCVAALRHTEGGGEAIDRASKTDQHSQLAGLGVELDDLVEEDDLKPISEEEKQRMYAVLHTDALDLDDVVAEVQGAVGEMEDQLMRISDYIAFLQGNADRQRQALTLFKSTLSKTPGYISAAVAFQSAWETERQVLLETREQVEGLAEIFAGFHHAYDGLIVEVQRRRHVQSKMEKVMKHAAKELDKLFEDDLVEREAFRTDQGQFLPTDIWPDLSQEPNRYNFVSANETATTLPELSRSVYESAKQRLLARTG